MSDSDESGSTDVVENWIYEYTRAVVWLLLKNYSSNTAFNDELLRGALLKAQHDDNRSDDVFLAQWMFLVRNGRDLLTTADDGITPLEEVLSSLPLLRERFKSLDHKKLAKTERLLVEQAILICMEKHEFVLARHVKSRLWAGDLNPATRKLGDCLDKAIAKGLLPTGMSSFQDLISASVDLLEDLCQNRLARPFLIKMAKDEARRRNSKKSGENRRILIKTGIKLTGPLLNAFVTRHALVPEEGAGFLPPDKFQSALDELRGRKDELLKNIPECLSVLTSAATPRAVTPSAVTPSAVTPSVVTPSAVTPSGSPEKTKSVRRRTYEKHGTRSRSTRLARRRNSERDNSTDRESEGDVLSLRERLGVSDNTFVGVQAVVRPQFRKNPVITVRRIPRSRWTKKEEDSLFESVKRLGVGNWAEIVETGVLPGRSNVDLKDKWRSMVKKEERAQELQSIFDSQLSAVGDDK